MAATALPLSAAARRLRVSRRTLQRWCAAGMPHTRTSTATLVDLDAVERWRAGAAEDALAAFGRVADWAWRRDAGDGLPLWRHLRIGEDALLAALVVLHDRLALELGLESGELPAELRRMMTRLLSLRGFRIRERRKDASKS